MPDIEDDALTLEWIEKMEASGFGLARTKTEGVAMIYDPDGHDPNAKPVRLSWRDRLMFKMDALGHRLRWLPDRVWWAFFGSGDW